MKRWYAIERILFLVLLWAVTLEVQAQIAAPWQVRLQRGGLYSATLSFDDAGGDPVDMTAKDSVIYVVKRRNTPADTALTTLTCDSSEMTCADGSVTIEAAVSSFSCPASSANPCYHELRVREIGEPAPRIWLAGTFQVNPFGVPGPTSGTTQTFVIQNGNAAITATAVTQATSLATSWITGLTELLTGESGDFLPIYDASASAWKKLDHANLPAGGGGSGDNFFANGNALTNVNLTDSTEIAVAINRTASPDEASLYLVAGSIANSKLTNSSVSYGGISLALGGSDATPAFNLVDATGYLVSSLSGTLADLNTALGSSIANGAHFSPSTLSSDYSITGTADATTFVRGDGTYAVPAYTTSASDLISGTLANTRLNSSVTLDAEWDTIGEIEAIIGVTLCQSDGTGCAADSEGYATVQDEGSALTQRGTINFTGAGVACVDNAGASRTDCTVSSGGGSGTMTTVKEGGVQVGDADIQALDFDGDDFNATESPDTEVNITINDAGVDHNATTNYDANEHVGHTGVTLTAGVGLSGGGDISASRSFAFDATELDGLTWSDGAQSSLIWTYAVTGTNPAFTFSDGNINVSSGTFTVGGTAASLAGHTHTESDITDFGSYLTAVTGTELDNVFASNGLLQRTGAATYGLVANLSALNTALGSSIADGAHFTPSTLASDYSISGTADGTTFVRGDGTYAVPAYSTECSTSGCALNSATTASTPSVGDDDTSVATTAFVHNEPFAIEYSLSATTGDLSTGSAVLTRRMPYAVTVDSVWIYTSTAPAGAAVIVDANEGGVSIFSTRPQIDAGDETSVSSGTSAVISDASIASLAEMTFDIDQVGSSTAGTGLAIILFCRRQ